MDGNFRSLPDIFYLLNASQASLLLLYKCLPILSSRGGSIGLFLSLQIFTSGFVLCVGAAVLGCPLYVQLRYNCRVWVYNRRILLVRPKMVLADDLNYRESRYFARWYASPGEKLEELHLPLCITHVTGQTTAPFGMLFFSHRHRENASTHKRVRPLHVRTYLHIVQLPL